MSGDRRSRIRRFFVGTTTHPPVTASTNRGPCNPVRALDEQNPSSQAPILLSPRTRELSSQTTTLPTSTLPTSPTQAPASDTLSAQQCQVAREFNGAALALLNDKQRSIIKTHIGSDVEDDLQATWNAANDERNKLNDKRWKAKANAVLLWLHRFRSVGTIMAAADPIHAGLPWAGIRFILEVGAADHKQMLALVDGMDLALSLANRLQAYFAFYVRLPPSLSTVNLRLALTELYAHLLRFLATALEICSLPTTKRKLQAVWNQSEIVRFEEQSDVIAHRVAMEASNCDRELHMEQKTVASKYYRNLKSDLLQLDTIQESTRESVSHIGRKIDLSKLSIVLEATWNASAAQELAPCLKGTRSEILDDIAQWAAKPDGKFIFWLCGMAGTGKSTIARTVAERFEKALGDEKSLLGASFFFKRGEVSRNNAKRFFPTVAGQLADLLPGMKHAIAAALEADSFLNGKGLQEQFEKLLLEPLRTINVADLPRHNITIVIDALDECDMGTDIQIILRLFARLNAESTIGFRLFMTSRGELPIRLGFARLRQSLHEDIRLEEIQDKTIARDLRVYFEYQFSEMREVRMQIRPHDPLPLHWPSEHDLRVLVNQAFPLFIFASTVCRFVSEADPRKRLKMILAQRYASGTSQLAKTYLPILEYLLLEKSDHERIQVLADFRAVVGPIVLAADPLSVESLSKLLLVEQATIEDLLEHLHAVLHVPPGVSRPVNLLHQSFRDFLVDEGRKDDGDFWIDERDTHRRLATCCLDRLIRPGTLKSDICEVGLPGFRQAQLPTQIIARQIPPELAYACCHLSLHLRGSSGELRDDGPVLAFLHDHFLHWLEALAWLGKFANAVTYINDLLFIAKGDQCRRAADFLADAKRFVLTNRTAITVAPLQLYHSAIMFTPINSMVLEKCREEAKYVESWELFPESPSHWSPELLKLEGHESLVVALGISPDCQTIASASYDNTLRLWNAQTGEERHRLDIGVVEFDTEEPGLGTAISFSTDSQTVSLTTVVGFQVAAGRIRFQSWNVQIGSQLDDSGDPERIASAAFSTYGRLAAIPCLCPWGSVQLMDTSTGKQSHRLIGHFSCITALEISTDCQHVAAGSVDGTIQLWDANSGTRKHKIQGHRACVTRLTFVPSWQALLSADLDGNIELWELITGEKKLVFGGSMERHIPIAVTHDGKMMIFKAGDLWRVHSDQYLMEITSQSRKIREIASWPEKSILAMITDDGTLQIWDMQTSEQIHSFQSLTADNHADTATDYGHMAYGGCEIAFSPDGKAIAWLSGLELSLIDIQTGEQRRLLYGDHDILVTRSWIIGFLEAGLVLAVIAAVNLLPETQLWNVHASSLIYRSRFDIGSIAAKIRQPDGLVVMTQQDSVQTMQTMNIRTGEISLRFDMNLEQVTAACFAQARSLLAIGSNMGLLQLYDITKGENVRNWNCGPGQVAAIITSPDGNITASISSVGLVRVWDVQTGLCLQDIEPNKGVNKDWNQDIDMSCERDEQEKQESMSIWSDTDSELEKSKNCVRSVTFSWKSDVMAIQYESKVDLWNVYGWHKLQSFQAGSDSLSFLPNDQILASFRGRYCTFTNVQSGTAISMITCSQAITAGSFSSNDQLVTASDDGAVQLWSIRDNQSRESGVNELHGRLLGSEEEYSKSHTIALSAGTQDAASITVEYKFSTDIESAPATIQLWNLRSNTIACTAVFQFQTNHAIGKLMFSPEGTVLAYCDHMESIRVWNVQTMEQMPTINSSCQIMALSSDGDLLVLATKTEDIWEYSAWHTKNGEKVRGLGREHAHDIGRILGLAISPDGLMIAAASDTSKLILWHIQTGGQLLISEDSDLTPQSGAVTFSADGHSVVVATSTDESVNILKFGLWDVQTGERIQMLTQTLKIDSGTLLALPPQEPRMAFSYDTHFLTTSCGILDLQWTPSGMLMEPQSTLGIEVVNPWIRFHGRDALFLPYNRRTSRIASNGRTVMISNEANSISFFRVRLG